MRTEAPNIKPNITNNLLEDAEKSFRNKEYDLQIDIFEVNNSACFNKALYLDPPMVIARKNHPRLDQKTRITMSEYLAEKHAVLSIPSSIIHPLSTIVSDVKKR